MNAPVTRFVASVCLLLGTAACTLQIGNTSPRPIMTAAAPVAVAPTPGVIPVPPLPGTLTPGLLTAVQSVQDSRMSSSPMGSTTMVTVAFSGEVAFRAKSVAAVRVTAAVDDRGNRLNSSSTLNPPPNLLAGSGPNTNASTGMLRISGVPREAREIRYLDGEVDLFSPDDNAGSIVIPGLLGTAGRPLDHADLERLGIRITYVDATSYQAIRASFSYGQPVTDFTNQAVFFIQDPNNRLRSMSLEDPQGRIIAMQQRGGTSAQGSRLIQYGLTNGPLPSDTRIHLELNLPEAIKTHLFRIEHIALP